ncbi:AMP-dependent synthetase/ligase [Trinorchestia longiramus]|nr:AMP-dependent synthetase/ligase [Trinorchestia longiramus]
MVDQVIRWFGVMVQVVWCHGTGGLVSWYRWSGVMVQVVWCHGTGGLVSWYEMKMGAVRGVREGNTWRKTENVGYEPGVKLVAHLREESIITIPDIIKYSASKNGDQPWMATRTMILRHFEEVKGKKLEKLELGDYVWTSYKNVYEDVLVLTKAVFNLGLKPKSRIAMFAETRAEWYTFSVACMNAGMTIVTLYTNLNDDGIAHGVKETEVDTVVTSYDLFPRLVKVLTGNDQVKQVIVFEDQLEGIGDAKSKLPSVNVLSYSQVRKMGKESTQENTEGPKPDDLAIIMYTSGSTGNPKGVQLSHRNIFAAISAYISQAHLGPGDCYLAYLPLAHVLELATETALMAMGVSIAYSSPLTLTNNSPKIMKGTVGDARMARPTAMSAVPLILDRIIKGVMTNVERQGKITAKVFSLSLRCKQSMNYSAGILSQLLDAVIFNKVKAELGGRLRMLVVGGAPLSTRTHLMIKAMFGCSLQVAYAATETSACATSMDVDDCTTGHCGPPNPNTIIKLEDWEEGGYRVTDEPRPRGEVVIGGDCVASGYFKLPAETQQAFYEEDGIRWFRTGDIGEMDENGCLRIIDRMKDLVKLQNGEYVSLGNVEAILKTHAIVDNICVFCDSNQNNTVAVVVPAAEILKKIAAGLSKSESQSVADLCNDADVVKAVLQALQSHGKSQKLNRAEIPTALFLTSEPWTPDNGLVTAALKLRRNPVVKHFSEQISAMYASS